MTDILFDPTLVRPLLTSQVSRGILGEDAQIGDTVQIDTNDRAMLSTASTAAGVTGNIGLIVGAGNAKFRTDGQLKADDPITICWQGRVAVNKGDLDTGVELFASDTPGKLADVAGTNSRKLAAPINKNVIYFNGLVS